MMRGIAWALACRFLTTAAGALQRTAFDRVWRRALAAELLEPERAPTYNRRVSTPPSLWSWIGPATLLVLAVVASVATMYHPAVGGVLALLFLSVLVGRVIACAALAVLLIGLPLFNPPIIGNEFSGRVYLSAAFTGVLVVAVAGITLRPRATLPPGAVLVAVLCIAFLVVLARPGAEGGLSWAYKPVQPVLIALAVKVLLHERVQAARRFMTLLVAFGTVGAALGFVSALVPALDVFAVSRPADLPWTPTLASGVVRASGAFVYPNVFGMFCVYLAITAVGAKALGYISARMALPAVIFGMLGILTASARAALGGLIVGFIVAAFALDRRRRISRILLGASLLFLILAALTYNDTGREVLVDRLSDATGQSLEFRRENTAVGWDIFVNHPLLGTGATRSRLDNGLVLVLANGGIVGFALLSAAFVAVASVRGSGRGLRSWPPASLGLIAALVASSLLQDSLGQTLSTVFLGVSLGLFAVLRSPPAALPQSSADDLQRRSAEEPNELLALPVARL